jgi:CRISPR-associated protein Cas5d
MQMSFKVEVWGDWALFSRPELKAERYSYDVMTPSAARGILDAIYWHPGLRWIPERIYVLNPIRFTGIRRNEVNAKIPGSAVSSVMNGAQKELYLSAHDEIVQRAATVLQDVRYVIEAHFEMTPQAAPEDNEGKFCDIMKRRLEKGQCYHQPCFGCRELPAHFRSWAGGEIPAAGVNEDRDLGLMLYDLDYSDPPNITPMFFRAALKNGVLNIPAPDSREVLR